MAHGVYRYEARPAT